MREIKYRQPVFVQGKFDRFHYWGAFEEGVFLGPIGDGKNSKEYTGLKDKNGKEIYEGDIISQEVSNTLAQKGVYETYAMITKVVFDNGGFCKYLLTPRGEHSIGTLMSFGYMQEKNTNCLIKEEIIGNQYENPELLQSKL